MGQDAEFFIQLAFFIGFDAHCFQGYFKLTGIGFDAGVQVFVVIGQNQIYRFAAYGPPHRRRHFGGIANDAVNDQEDVFGAGYLFFDPSIVVFGLSIYILNPAEFVLFLPQGDFEKTHFQGTQDAAAFRFYLRNFVNGNFHFAVCQFSRCAYGQEIFAIKSQGKNKFSGFELGIQFNLQRIVK